MHNVGLALILTLGAGMATGIGSAIAFLAKRTNYRFLSVATGFSAGVMLYVSFVEMLFEGQSALAAAYGPYWSHWVNVGAFFAGMGLLGLIDSLIPSAGNPHETHTRAEIAPLGDPSAPMPDFEAIAAGATPTESGAHDHRVERDRLMRMGLFTALAIALHNFPEGLATFMAGIQSPGLGLGIAVAIAMHNIPEGISVSVPIFYATGNRRTAFLYSLASGLAEPLGALIAYLALRLSLGTGSDAMPPQLMGIILAGVAGIMVYISIDELLPTSRAFGKGHDSLWGVVSGMAAMALSLLLMQ
jgi:zinc transporter, ZIP family